MSEKLKEIDNKIKALKKERFFEKNRDDLDLAKEIKKLSDFKGKNNTEILDIIKDLIKFKNTHQNNFTKI